MMNEAERAKLKKLLKTLTVFYVIEIIAMVAVFINNGQQQEAITMGVFSAVLLGIIYFTTDIVFANNSSYYKIFPVYVISVMVILVVMFSTAYEKRFFIVGDMSFKFPKEIGFIYDKKDANNKCYYVEYYYDLCSIEVQKTLYNEEYQVFENIKNNVQLERKITDTIRKEDVYNSKFTEGKKDINGKEWKTFSTKIENMDYTIYYRIVDNDLYVMDVANYNNNPKECTKKVNEAFKTIEYKK